MRGLWLAAVAASLFGAVLCLWHFHLSPQRPSADDVADSDFDKPTGSLFLALAWALMAAACAVLATVPPAAAVVGGHSALAHLLALCLAAVPVLAWAGTLYTTAAKSGQARALAAFDALLSGVSVTLILWWIGGVTASPIKDIVASAGPAIAEVAAVAALCTVVSRYPFRVEGGLAFSTLCLIVASACTAIGFGVWWGGNSSHSTLVAALWSIGALVSGFGIFLENRAYCGGRHHLYSSYQLETALTLMLPCGALLVGLWRITSSHHGTVLRAELWWAPLLVVAAAVRVLALVFGAQSADGHIDLSPQNRLLQEKLKRRTQQLSALHAITADLNATLDSEKLIAAALDRIKDSVEADAATLWLMMGDASGTGQESEADSMVVNASALLREVERGAAERRSLESLKIGRLDSDGHSVSAETTTVDVDPAAERLWRTVRQLGDRPDARAMVAAMRNKLEEGGLELCRNYCNSTAGATHVAAICWKGDIIGAMGVARLDGAWDAPELALLDALALEIGVSLQNAQLFQEASRLADRDSLTDLLNHRALQGQLIAILSRARRIPTDFSIVMMDVENFQFFNDTYGHAVGDRVLRTVAQCLRDACRTSDVLGRFGGDEFVAILMDTDIPGTTEVCSRIATRLQQESFQVSGDGRRIPIGLSFGASLHPQDGANAMELISIANTNLQESKVSGKAFVITDKAAQTQEMRQLKDVSVGGSFGVLDALVTAIDNKDRYTRRHSEDVSHWATLMSQQMEHSEETQRAVRICGLLHDVGKIAVPDAILRKPGRLNDDEFNIMQQHPVFGALIVKDVPNLTEVLGGIRHHHERYDGKGYPDKIAGEAIPLLGRMLAVPDCFSAMTTERPYRKALSWQEAIAEIEKGTGTQFDPMCAEAFLEVIANIISEGDGSGVTAEPELAADAVADQTVMRPRSVADADAATAAT